LAPSTSIVTPPASIVVARERSRTVTPSSASWSATLPESLSLNAANTLSPASRRITFAALASIRRKCRFIAWAVMAS
jgi:hypothetical protein